MTREEEEKKQAQRQSFKQHQRLQTKYHKAYSEARSGDGRAMRKVIEEGNLDVNAPEKLSRLKDDKAEMKYTTMLHAAAPKCDVSTIEYLIQKGTLASSDELVFTYIQLKAL